jgi:hypothetical protein
MLNCDCQYGGQRTFWFLLTGVDFKIKRSIKNLYTHPGGGIDQAAMQILTALAHFLLINPSAILTWNAGLPSDTITVQRPLLNLIEISAGPYRIFA